MTYAKGTSVEPAASQAEIGKTLARYKVDSYSFRQAPGRAEVEFMYGQTPIRIGIDLPERPATRSGRNPATGRPIDLVTRWEQEIRERWRGLALFVKAGLEACEMEVAEPDEVFMAFLVSADGSTLGERILPRYREAIAAGTTMAITS